MKTDRREFIFGSAALGSVGLAGCLSGGRGDGPSPGKQVRFCLFDDLHYWPGVFPNDSTDFLDRILARARAADVDFVLHLGGIEYPPYRENGQKQDKDRKVEKRVFAPNHFRPESQEAKEVVCVFAAAELPSGPVDVEVRPAAFFGKEGRGIRGRVS